MRLNLGCGTDIIDGYVNIDINPQHEKVVQADFRDLRNVVNQPVDEIKAIACLQSVPYNQIEQTIQHWTSLLRPGARIRLQDLDLQLLANQLIFEQITLEQFNQSAYPSGAIATYTLPFIESLLLRNNISIEEKGYNGFTFFLNGVKN